MLGSCGDLSKNLWCLDDLPTNIAGISAVENGKGSCVHSAVWAQSILVLLYCQDNNTLTEHLLVELVQIRDFMYRETVVSSQFRHRGFLLEYHQGTTFQTFDCCAEIGQGIHQPGLVGNDDSHRVATGTLSTHGGNDGAGGKEHVALMVQHDQ